MDFNDLNNSFNDFKKSHYFSYTKRVILFSCLFFIFFGFTIMFCLKSFNHYDPEIINYKETSNLDYRVYLKKNSFYEEEYLEKDMLYVASLVDKVDVDFNYLFSVDKNISVEFNYDIYAKLFIKDDVKNKVYFEKEYLLLKDKKFNMINSNKYSIFENVSIDYDYYNSLANDFKKLYGIDTDSSLIVYMKINKQSLVQELDLNENSLMSITIPLSLKSIDIKMNYQEINNSNRLINNENFIVSNFVYLIFGAMFLIFTLILLIKLIRLLSLLYVKRSEYDKYVNKIINEYDRLIVENSSGPNFKDKDIIKINKFEELLDVRDNLKLPISYYNVVKHHKCYFYIRHESDIYLMTVKAIDFVKKD